MFLNKKWLPRLWLCTGAEGVGPSLVLFDVFLCIKKWLPLADTFRTAIFSYDSEKLEEVKAILYQQEGNINGQYQRYSATRKHTFR